MAAKDYIKEYISSIIELVNELKNEVNNRCSYKVIEVIQDKQRNILLKIQVLKGQHILTCHPKEIVMHDGFLEGFSKKDIRTITYYATKALGTPSVEVIEQAIDPTTNRKFFHFLDKEKGEIFKKTASEISKTPTLLQKMDQLDAHLIGYAACSQSLDEEREELNKLKAMDS